MTRKELAIAIYEIKKDTLPNVIGSNSPLTKEEFIKRYLNGVGGTRGFSKEALESLLESLKEKQGI